MDFLGWSIHRVLWRFHRGEIGLAQAEAELKRIRRLERAAYQVAFARG